MDTTVILNEDQKAAIAAIESGRNVFLTGEGGTGKSATVKQAVSLLHRNGRKTVLCAPTGIAAQNIHGATIHSVFRFDLGPMVADVLENVQPSKVVHEADTIIIDEIGMVRRDIMDSIARVVELENKARAHDPERKSLQLVVVGDFSQLPPVVTDKDRPVLVSQYGQQSAGTGFYAFEADGWESMGFMVCQLTKPMRQSDPVFVAMLNRARIGDASCLNYFNRLAERPDAPSSAVSIVARNKQADQINLSRLKAIKGEREQFLGTVDGEFKSGDMAAPKTLELKVGARVLCVANDKEAGYVNGSTGTVADLHGTSDDGTPAVMVSLDDGGEVAVTRKEWENTVYRVTDDPKGRKRLEQVVIGTYTQFPLKLAWAITFHKSQGQTLAAVSIDPDTFGSGMLYVGLSRATSAAGIWLTHKIKPSSLNADESVVKFYETACGWTAPKPAEGDEAPDLAPIARDDEVPAVVYNSGETGLMKVQNELHELLASSGRTWVRVYELIDLVFREKLYKPEHRSFTAWMKAAAKREGITESVLWHRKSAGDFYAEWAEGKPDAPPLAEGNRLSEDNLNLVRKIAKINPNRGDELMHSMVNEGLSTKALRREWGELRGKGKAEKLGERPCAKVRASRSGLSISCDDAETFDAVIAAIRSAGIAIE